MIFWNLVLQTLYLKKWDRPHRGLLNRNSWTQDPGMFALRSIVTRKEIFYALWRWFSGILASKRIFSGNEIDRIEACNIVSQTQDPGMFALSSIVTRKEIFYALWRWFSGILASNRFIFKKWDRPHRGLLNRNSSTQDPGMFALSSIVTGIEIFYALWRWFFLGILASNRFIFKKWYRPHWGLHRIILLVTM